MMDDNIDELYDEIDNNSDEQNAQNKKNKTNICDHFSFICFFYIIESLISIAGYYLFYKIQFTDDKNRKIKPFQLSFLICLLISLIFLYNLIECLKKLNNKKCSNIIQFILLYIHKILFFVYVYLITVADKEERMGFSHFQARMFWKLSICVLYLLLSIYYFCKKNETQEKKYIYALFSIISLLVYFFLALFIKDKDDNLDRIMIYLFFMLLEIFFSIVTIYVLKSDKNNTLKNNIEILNIIDWKINQIDFFKFLIPFFRLLFWNALKLCYTKSRFCKKLRKNFSL